MENQTYILIVEDEPKIRTGLKDFLEFHNFLVSEAADGHEADEMVAAKRFDLILLDLMLPIISGEQLCTQWRRNGLQTPIIMLTAKGQENEKVNGLNLGSDDYITKPFSLEELLARIQAVLRRIDPARKVSQTFYFDKWQVHLDSLTIQNQTAKKDISRREGQIIQYFAANPNRIISRKELFEKVWDDILTELGTRTIDMHIAKLRGKIEANSAEPKIIKTVRGAGYIYYEEAEA
ncbi:MAG: response regulator transcription factor [Phycisphaerae bacterium]|nr:response regulator transcription factor [Phycisphaerae bacterium]